MKPKFKGLGKLKPSRALVGTWRSDRAMTLEYWAFPKTASNKLKKIVRARDFFGNLHWQVTRKQLTTWYPTLPLRSMPYRVVWENPHSIAIVFPRDTDRPLRHIVFVDPDRFFMLAGMANCEWFKRVKSRGALERATRSRARANQLAKRVESRPRAAARRDSRGTRK